MFWLKNAWNNLSVKYICEASVKMVKEIDGEDCSIG